MANSKVYVSEQDREKLEDLKASEKLIAQLNETWEEKLSKADEIKQDLITIFFFYGYLFNFSSDGIGRKNSEN